MELAFEVGPGVLVPRPETELLVDGAVSPAPQARSSASHRRRRRHRLRRDRHQHRRGDGTGLAGPHHRFGHLPGRRLSCRRNRARLDTHHRVALVQGSLSALAPAIRSISCWPTSPTCVGADRGEFVACSRAPIGARRRSDGLDLIRQLLDDAPRVLAPGGAIGWRSTPASATTSSPWRGGRSRSPRFRCSVTSRDSIATVIIHVSPTDSRPSRLHHVVTPSPTFAGPAERVAAKGECFRARVGT